MFAKGTHERQFAYEAHTVLVFWELAFFDKLKKRTPVGVRFFAPRGK